MHDVYTNSMDGTGLHLFGFQTCTYHHTSAADTSTLNIFTHAIAISSHVSVTEFFAAAQAAS